MITHDNIVGVVEHAKSLVERGWCQYNRAEDWKGRRVSPLSDNARRWCMTGAIDAGVFKYAGSIGDRQMMYSRLKDELGLTFYEYVTTWNDWPGRTQGQVVRVMEKVLEHVKKEVENARN